MSTVASAPALSIDELDRTLEELSHETLDLSLCYAVEEQDAQRFTIVDIVSRTLHEMSRLIKQVV